MIHTLVFGKRYKCSVYGSDCSHFVCPRFLALQNKDPGSRDTKKELDLGSGDTQKELDLGSGDTQKELDLVSGDTQNELDLGSGTRKMRPK